MSEFFCNFADKLIIKMNMNTELNKEEMDWLIEHLKVE